MDIQKCSGVELVRSLKSLVQSEREVLMRILELLREVENRKLHLEMGYPDLYSFAMRELGYSSGAAYRRISAMRLLKSVPGAGEKLASGELQLENASQAQSFFRKEDQRRREFGEEKLTLDLKSEIVQSLVGKSTLDGLRLLTELSPDVMTPTEKVRPLHDSRTLVQFVAGPDLMGKLEELKGLLAHQNFEGRMDVLIEKLADLALRKLKPSPAPGTPRPEVKKPAAPDSPAPRMLRPAKKPALTESPAPRSRSIPASERRKVLLRDTNGCMYRDPVTGRVCGSRHGLQLDHRVPFSQGGENRAENLRLLCGAHNRLRASWSAGGRTRPSG